MNRILVATDLSPLAEDAFCYAAGMALHYDAGIILCHVASPSPFLAQSPGDLMETNWQELASQLKEELNAYMQLAVNRYGIDPERIQLTADVRNGNIVDQILESADEWNVDLIVAGTHGKSGLGEVFFGTYTTALIQRTTRPLVAVPPGRTYKPLKHIALAVDYKDVDEEVLRSLIAMRQSFNCRLTLVHIEREGDGPNEDELYNLRQYVESIHNEPDVAFDFVPASDTFSALNEFIDDNNIDLLAMEHRRDTFLDVVTRTSLTRKMTTYTVVPLLVYRKKH